MPREEPHLHPLTTTDHADPADPATAAAPAAPAGAAVGLWLTRAVLTLLGLALTALLVVVGIGLWDLAGSAAATASRLAAVITTPVHSYLAAHAGPLPVSASTLHTTWAATGIGLWFATWAGSTGARIGWVLIGLATAAMAHTATPDPAAWLATGVTALTWGLLSTLTFSTAGHHPVVIHRELETPTDTS